MEPVDQIVCRRGETFFLAGSIPDIEAVVRPLDSAYRFHLFVKQYDDADADDVLAISNDMFQILSALETDEDINVRVEIPAAITSSWPEGLYRAYLEVTTGDGRKYSVPEPTQEWLYFRVQ